MNGRAITIPPLCSHPHEAEEGENAERAFNRHMANNSAHSEKLQKMLKATESVQKINETRQAEEEYDVIVTDHVVLSRVEPAMNVKGVLLSQTRRRRRELRTPKAPKARN